MKINEVVIILIFCIFADVYSAIEIYPVSPYIDKKVSLEYQLSNNPITITHYYESEAKDDIYFAYQNSIYLTEGINRKKQNFYVKIGNNEEKKEIMSGIGFLGRFFLLNIRMKINHIDTGKNILFNNLAISYFGGASYESFYYDEYENGNDKGAIMFYGGTSFGTRKKIDKFSYFEIFTNPHFSITYYYGLGGKFDPKLLYESKWPENKTGEYFGLWMPEFLIPVGLGIKYRNFFVKSGIVFSTAIGGEKRDLNRAGTLIDKVVVDSQNFSFFINLGIHFGKFRNLEKN